jgi:hypothetical protein
LRPENVTRSPPAPTELRSRGRDIIGDETLDHLATPSAGTTIPLFPCTSIEPTLEFYRALGFDVTGYTEPHSYGTARRGGVELHFTRLSMYGAKNAFGASLVFVDGVPRHHRDFADALRSKLGSLPVAGLPRITRLHPGQTRFMIFDPSGNMIVFIERSEASAYREHLPGLSPLAEALQNAVFLRDTYANDEAAAKVLDRALAENPSPAPIDRARVLAARAELAVALGDRERAWSLQVELAQVPLSTEERDGWREELDAAQKLERWLTVPG